MLTGHMPYIALLFPRSQLTLAACATGRGPIQWEIIGLMEKSRDAAGAVGFDFGTTNSSVAHLDSLSDGNFHIKLASFSTTAGATASFRSVLYFEQSKSPAGIKRVHAFTGPDAIDHYLRAEEKGRLVQSLKSHLPSRTLTGTEVFGRRYKIEDLIARILSDLRKHSDQQFGNPVSFAMVGRPVRFVGAETDEDQEFALTRLRAAFAAAGIERVAFEMEPVAAAYAYESTLDHDELILIGDFGGGTSDFSLLRVGPEVRRRGRTARDLLGNGGLGLAGDAFDARIIRKLVSPALGSNSEARSLNKLLPAVPAWIYANLERWHYLSFLRTNNVREILKSAHLRALEPEKIAALIAIVDDDLGYQLHQSVQHLKYELSSRNEAEFRFNDSPHLPTIDLRIPVTRAEFESWIEEDLQAIETCVDSLLQSSGIDARAVDRSSDRHADESRRGKDTARRAADPSRHCSRG
jgi:hypothetical chaperone protein